MPVQYDGPAPTNTIGEQTLLLHPLSSSPQGQPNTEITCEAAPPRHRGPAGWARVVAPPGPPTDPDVRVAASGSSGNSFAARSYPLQLRQDRTSDRCPSSLSLQRFRAPVLLFPPRGPSAVPPLHRYFRSTPTPHDPSYLASLPSLSSTAGTSVVSLLQEVGRLTPAGLDPSLPVALPAPSHGDHGVSQVPG